MKVSDAFKGAFLKAADVQSKPKILSIASIGEEEVQDETKVVMRFENADQALILNKTNATILAEVWGYEMDDWIGKKVKLKADKTPFNGNLVPCIRVEPMAEKSSASNDALEDDLNV